MQLFYSPNACSLAVHIVLREIDATFDLIQVDLQQHRTLSGQDFFAINPKGQVPYLQLDKGIGLTEGAVICQFLVDQGTRHDLLAAPPHLQRYQVLEWMNFIASELHKSYSPFFHPEFTEQSKDTYKSILMQHYQHIDHHLKQQPYLTGETFTLADIYMFVVTRWAAFIELQIESYPHLLSFMQRIQTRSSVMAALEAE